MECYDYVAYKEGSKCFYISQFFKFNQYYSTDYDVFEDKSIYTNLLIKDIINNFSYNKRVHSNYYYNSLINKNIFFINNHPLNKISIVGFVINFTIKSIINKEYMFIKIDDSSIGIGSKAYLECKISLNDLKNINLFNSNRYGSFMKLICKKIKLYGSINIKYDEFEIEYIELLDDKNSLILECEHWKNCIEVRKQLLEREWTVDNETLRDFLFANNNNNNNNNTKGSIEDGYHVSMKTANNYLEATVINNYIEELQTEVIRNEIEITSPYRLNNDDDSNFSMELMNSYNSQQHNQKNLFLLPERLSTEQNKNKMTFSATENSTIVNDSKNLTHECNKPIPVINSKKLNKGFLRLLLFSCNDSILIEDLYLLPQVQELIENYNLVSVLNQDLSQKHNINVKLNSDNKKKTYNTLIENLMKLHMIEFDKNSGIISLKNLHSLHRYSNKHCKLLISLHCNTVTINHDVIRKKLGIINIPNMAIIKIYKEVIKNLLHQNPSLLDSWFIEVNTDRASLIYLEYHKNDTKN